ncbi:MAG: hypothetical protein K1X44_06835 [Alphaproteobacteria bacterium]|nr:hypothetical protein [Alphaproteobacteria bacterium]
MLINYMRLALLTGLIVIGVYSSNPAQSQSLPSHDYEIEGIEVHIDELKRTAGNTVTLRWSYHNKSDEPKDITPKGTVKDDKLAQNVELVDIPGKKKYLPLEDGVEIITRKFTDDVIIPEGQTLKTWVKFPAPPKDVKSIDVYIPKVEPFEGVAIQE